MVVTLVGGAVGCDVDPTAPGSYRASLISAGDIHVCYHAEAGTYCWGGNSSGQLGDGTRSPRDAATRVAARIDVAALVTGWFHSCALDLEGQIYCWGDNTTGALGDVARVVQLQPVAIPTALSIRRLVAGAAHSCALDASGATYCWGSNSNGQLGALDVVDTCVQDPCSARPVRVAGGITFDAITAGRTHTCGITSEGAAYCWGSNQAGKLGIGTTRSTAQPALVSGGHDFLQLSAGGTHTCGLTSNHELYCWGQNDRGQLATTDSPNDCGQGGFPCSTRPIPIAGDLRFRLLTAGGEHTCGLTDAGAAYCWGASTEGQVGHGLVADQSRPQRVAGGLMFQALAAGERHTCGVALDGTTYCWGDNFAGQLGIGRAGLPISEPRPVSFPEGSP